MAAKRRPGRPKGSKNKKPRRTSQEPIDVDDPRHSNYKGGPSMAVKRAPSTPSSRMGDDNLLEGKGPLYNMTLQREVKLQINPVAVGQLWHGFVMGLRNPCDDNGKSFDRQYPQTMVKHQGPCYEACGCDHQANKEWEKYSHQRGVGESMTDLQMAGNAIIKEELTEEELLTFYRRAKAAAETCAVVTPGMGVGPTGWSSPLGSPSVVTSPFGTKRGDHAHEGEDLRAADGTMVLAPTKMQIIKVGRDERAGLYVVANAFRPAGVSDNPNTFPRDVAGFDDSGWILTFAHLSSTEPGVVAAEKTSDGIQPTVGSIIEQGKPFARSGHSGGNAGIDGVFAPVAPHLHFQLEFFSDKTLFDERTFVDPRMLLPDPVIEGKMTFSPTTPNGKLTQAIVIPRGKTEKEQSGRALVISGNNNVVGFGRDRVTVVGMGGGNQLDVDLGLAPSIRNSIVSPRGQSDYSVNGAPTVVDSILRRPGGEGPLVMTERIPTDGAPPFVMNGPPTGLPEFLPTTLSQAIDLQSLSGKVLEGGGVYAGKLFDFVVSPQGVGAITKMVGGGLGVVGAAAQVASPLLSTFGGALSGIPYVGGYLAGAAEILGPILGPVGAGLSALGAAISGAGGRNDPLQSVFGNMAPLPSNQAGPPTQFQDALKSVFP